jgi:hypothetical protein
LRSRFTVGGNEEVSGDITVRVELADNAEDAERDAEKELAAGPIATEIRAAVERHEEALDGILVTMRSAQLPGADFIGSAVSQMRGIRRGNEENTILAFNASHKNIKDAIKRGADLEKAMTVDDVPGPAAAADQ